MTAASAPPPTATVLVVKLHLAPSAEPAFASWQSRALTLAAGFDGFVNSESAPGAAGTAQWIVALRFRDPMTLDEWCKSSSWTSLIAEAQRFTADDASVATETRDVGTQVGVVEVIVTRVKSGHEDAYRSWETRVQQAQSKYPGYLGSYVQPPIAGELGWTTLMRFATTAQLDDWLKSSERAALLREAEPLIDYAHLQRVDSSFPGWFPTDPGTGKGPPNWKAAMLVLLGLFPIVMLEARFFSPRLAGVNSSLAMFTGNVISVALTTWATMPLFIKVFGWWLFPKPGRSSSTAQIAGTATVMLLFAIEVAALWHLL